MENLELNFFQMVSEVLKAECTNFAPSGNLTSLDYTIVDANVFNLEGPVAVQIEYFNIDEQLFRYNLEKLIERRLNYVKRELSKEPIIKYAIIVTNLDNKILEDFKQDNGSNIPRNIVLWGSFEFGNLIQNHPHISSKYNQEYFVKLITEEFAKFILGADSRAEQIEYNANKYLTNLKKDLMDGELALFLGAGVSMSANLPSWTELVSKVYFEALLSKGIKIKDIVRQPQAYWQLTENIGNSNLMVRTKYAKLLLEENFIQIVHKWLYSHPARTSDMLKVLSNIIELTNSNKQRLVNYIVTYNYDDLIESHLKIINVPYSTIWRDSQRVNPASVGIYHVHGYLPYDNEYFTNNNIVFSEDEYHEQYKNPYSWSNIVQLNLLREKTCLFIGSSMSDPNTRRLLDVLKKGSGSKQHYIIYSRLYSGNRIQEINEIAGKIKELNRISGDFLSIVDKLKYLLMDEDVIKENMLAEELLIEKDFNNLGLNVIWVNTYKEVPLVLQKLLEEK